MTIIWNKVTWYSKLFAVVVLLITIWIAVYFVRAFQDVKTYSSATVTIALPR